MSGTWVLYTDELIIHRVEWKEESGLVGKYVQYHALTIENGKLEIGGNGHLHEPLAEKEWKFVPLLVKLRVLSRRNNGVSCASCLYSPETRFV